MRISGATFIRNAMKYDYPVVESIKSILSICDEFIVNVGDAVDNTLELIQSIGDTKIKILHSTWDTSLREKGLILSQQTNIALKECTGEWIFYLQADEVVHENDLDKIVYKAKKYLNDDSVDGLVFDYIHFYGSYYTYQQSRKWYRREVRVIKNNRGILAYGDAQGVRKNNTKINAILSGAKIYHYSWVKRDNNTMVQKMKDFHYWWHNDIWLKKEMPLEPYSDLGNLKVFTGTHPAVMAERVKEISSFVNIMRLREEYLRKRCLLDTIKDILNRNYLFEHRNYKLVNKD